VALGEAGAQPGGLTKLFHRGVGIPLVKQGQAQVQAGLYIFGLQSQSSPELAYGAV
jgi:hypothetical protein